MEPSIRTLIRLPALSALVLLGSTIGSCAVPGSVPVLEVRFPALPEAWLSALGDASWSLRWTDNDGAYQCRDDAQDGVQVELPLDTAAAILAYPYWPALGIRAGMARPAGAVHPFDEEGGALLLDWRGGPIAVFYRELAGTEGSAKTLPERFDWPRFRELLYGDLVAGEVSADPWLVDWRLVAVKTRASGFDRRRLVPRPTEPIEAMVPAAGPWVSSSPFAVSPSWAAGDTVILEAPEEPDAFLCAEGAFRYSQEAIVWLPAP